MEPIKLDKGQLQFLLDSVETDRVLLEGLLKEGIIPVGLGPQISAAIPGLIAQKKRIIRKLKKTVKDAEV